MTEELITYDNDINYGMHTVRVTIQCNKIRGHIYQKIKGNTHGKDVLDFDFEIYGEDIEKLTTSPNLHIRWDDEMEMFDIEFVDESGESIQWEADPEYLNEMIVAMEIVEYVEIDD